MKPPIVRMDLEWEPGIVWESFDQTELREGPTFRVPPSEEAESGSEFEGVRVENRLTRQIWYFEDVASLYFTSCVEGQFAIAGKQWTPGMYDIHNHTTDDLYVITSGKTEHLPAGGRVVLKAHNHV